MANPNLLPHSNKKWRAAGYVVGNTEVVNRFPAKVPGGFKVTRKDLYGFCDRVLTNGKEIIFLQVTSWKHVPTRVRKIREEYEGKGQHQVRIANIVRMLIAIPNVRVIVEGWKLDRKAYRWVSREHVVTLEDLE